MRKPVTKDDRDVLARRVRRLLAATCKAAARHRELQGELSPLLEDRYGMVPNDVDCDPYIDCTDYGQGQISLSQLDEEMEVRGYPPTQKS